MTILLKVPQSAVVSVCPVLGLIEAGADSDTVMVQPCLILRSDNQSAILPPGSDTLSTGVFLPKLKLPDIAVQLY